MLLNGHEVVYFGHSAFLIKSAKGCSILIDPWISNPANKKRLEEFTRDVQFILVTHAHGDHLGDTLELARSFNSEVIAIYEITNYLGSRGISKLTGMNIGGTVRRSGVSFTMVEATHSSTISDGERVLPGGNPCGFIITLEDNFRIYHMGDTGLIGSLEHIAKIYKPNLLLIPIGGHYTMGPEEAAYTIEVLNPDIVVPMHYKTFPVIDVNVNDLLDKLPMNLRERVKVLQPGEVLR